MKGRIKRFIAGLLTAVLILEGAGGTISYAEESGTQDAPPYSEENPFEMPSETKKSRSRRIYSGQLRGCRRESCAFNR